MICGKIHPVVIAPILGVRLMVPGDCTPERTKDGAISPCTYLSTTVSAPLFLVYRIVYFCDSSRQHMENMKPHEKVAVVKVTEILVRDRARAGAIVLYGEPGVGRCVIQRAVYQIDER